MSKNTSYQINDITRKLYPEYTISVLNYNVVRRTILTSNISYIHNIFIDGSMIPLFIMKNMQVVIPSISVVYDDCILSTSYLPVANIMKLSTEYNLNTGNNTVETNHFIINGNKCDGVLVCFDKYKSAYDFFNSTVKGRIKNSEYKDGICSRINKYFKKV